MGEAVESVGQSVRRTPKFLLLSTANFHFSKIANRQCWALNPFLKLHWNFDKIGSKYSDICLNINLSYILEIFDNIITSLWLSLDVFAPSLWTGVMIAFFKEFGEIE